MPEHIGLNPSEMPEYKISAEMKRAAFEYYHKNRAAFIEAAATARDNGVSHRDPPFKVGASIMGIDPSLEEGDYAIFTAYNVKPEPGPRKGKDKRCAERNGLDAAKEKNCKFVAAITTVSEHASTGDEDSRSSHDVLHPCQECRQMLRELMQEGFLSEETIICGVNDAEAKKGNPHYRIEERTLGSLLELYPDDILE